MRHDETCHPPRFLFSCQQQQVRHSHAPTPQKGSWRKRQVPSEGNSWPGEVWDKTLTQYFRSCHTWTLCSNSISTEQYPSNQQASFIYLACRNRHQVSTPSHTFYVTTKRKTNDQRKIYFNLFSFKYVLWLSENCGTAVNASSFYWKGTRFTSRPGDRIS